MLEQKVEAFLKRHHMNLVHKGILVGVSGGPDSLALLHYLWGLKEERNLQIVAGHVDHMFRGDESYEDALFVKDFCEQRGIPFEMARINVPEYIEKTGKSPQTAARDCRYNFFKKTMKKRGLRYLALGHHGDDQIETILMRLTRGSTGTARAGISFRRPFDDGEIIRPFLGINRQEIEEYCKRHGLEPRLDPSNHKNIYVRNRFRHHVLPFLKTENQQVHEHFQRFSEDLESDEKYLQELTVEKMKTVILSKEQGRVTIDIPAFRSMPMPLQRRGIQLILYYLYKEKPASLSAVHIDHVFSLLSSSHPSGTLDFPNNLTIVRSYHQCHFQFGKSKRKPFQFEIADPGIVLLPNGGKITMEYTNKDFSDKDLNCFVFNAKDVPLPLIIRSRKNGDRMTIKGMKGSKKIKDIFIDCKIPLTERDEWPVVTDRNGTILWLPGLKKSDLPVHEDENSRYIKLTYTKQ
jgi:tRNA(Ile)-lysidine synthase